MLPSTIRMKISSILDSRRKLNCKVNSIQFYDFFIEPGKVEFRVGKHVNREYKQDYIYFHLSKKFSPSHNVVATALATLCGKLYEEIYMDLNIDSETLSRISAFTGVDIKVRNVINVDRITDRKGIALSFSGGFDSLTSYCLMPQETQLVSIDFGHWFTREAEAFSKWETNILTTNFRRLNYDQASWTFMGVGAILFSEFLDIKYLAFGTNWNSSVGCYKYIANSKTDLTYNPSFFSPSDMISMQNFTYGLSNIGTAMVCATYQPSFLNASLNSLAAPGSIKLYRKKMLLDVVCARFGFDIEYSISDKPLEKRMRFGECFCTSALSLYFLKHLGDKVVSELIEIPESAIELIHTLSLDFYEKFAPVALQGIPEEFREDYIAKLKGAGVDLYNEKDWDEFRLVGNFLMQFM